MIRLIKYFKPKQVFYIFIAFLLIASQVYLELKIPDYISTRSIYGSLCIW